MFRRVNKIDHKVEEGGKYESGVDVPQASSVVVVGSDDGEVNNMYMVQPVKYNDHHVYKTATGSYLYFVNYEEGQASRWQVGAPNKGIQNHEPIAFVNADAETPDGVPTWQAWLVYDEEAAEWLRQSRVNTYNADCKATVSGAWNPDLNGQYSITPETYSYRPVFERLFQRGRECFRVVMFMDEAQGQFSRWAISEPDGEIGDVDGAWAFIQSSALTADGVTEFETWTERDGNTGELVANENLKVEGDCAKVKEHDWRRRRKARREDRNRDKAMKAVAEKHCPGDIVTETDEGENFATVHWNPYDQQQVTEGQDFEVEYDDAGLAPGQQFPLGRTAVTYVLKQEGGHEAKTCSRTCRRATRGAWT